MTQRLVSQDNCYSPAPHSIISPLQRERAPRSHPTPPGVGNDTASSTARPCDTCKQSHAPSPFQRSFPGREASQRSETQPARSLPTQTCQNLHPAQWDPPAAPLRRALFARDRLEQLRCTPRAPCANRVVGEGLFRHSEGRVAPSSCRESWRQASRALPAAGERSRASPCMRKQSDTAFPLRRATEKPERRGKLWLRCQTSTGLGFTTGWQQPQCPALFVWVAGGADPSCYSLCHPAPLPAPPGQQHGLSRTAREPVQG